MSATMKNGTASRTFGFCGSMSAIAGLPAARPTISLQRRAVEVELVDADLLEALALAFHAVPELLGVANHNKEGAGRIVVGLRGGLSLFRGHRSDVSRIGLKLLERQAELGEGRELAGKAASGLDRPAEAADQH